MVAKGTIVARRRCFLQNDPVRRALLGLLVLAAGLISSTAPVAADRWYAPAPMLGIVDAGRQPAAAREAGASWDRALFLWQLIQPNGPSDWAMDSYLDQAKLKPTLMAGLPVVGVVQGTPGWAARDWHDGASAVPSGLEFPLNDPRNTFGQFMLHLAQQYKGRITTWIIWNEPDFLPGESGTWWTWSGNAADFFRLMRTGYRAIKEVDPNATVVFPATTYFADAVHGRELFLGRVLQEANTDREAAANGFYFDAVGVNLYCSLDALYRVYGVYSSILAGHQLNKPLWLTETNCPVYNDKTTPQPASGRITTDEQAAFLIEAVALARAAGYQRIGWYTMIDHADTSGIFDRWGLLRADGSPRPAFRAFQVASQYLAQPGVTARLAPLGIGTPDGWPITRVILDDLSQRTRVQVLWRTADGPASVNVEAAGSAARLIDPLGFSSAAKRTDAGWDVPLPAVRVAQGSDPPGFQSNGYPILLLETGLPPEPPAAAPRVSSPLMALAPSVVEGPPRVQVAAQPPPLAVTRPSVAVPSIVAALPPTTQPGPSLVLSVGNPQPNDLLPRGKYVMHGLAFDRAANAGSGVDKVSVFIEDRDAGGQLVGDAVLGQPGATGFTLTADLSRAGGGHTLFVYARSSVSGRETVVSFPIVVGAH
jgi:polysaccharide biosynthesis protein PslG